VISPRGNGLDTHRLWEALYLGSLPIVKTSSLDLLYQNLPVLIVQEWEQVTEELLRKKAKELTHSNPEPLTIYYWLDQIDSYR
jgi:hypothetical protein